MKSALLAFALTALAAPAASAQQLAPALDDAPLTIESTGRPQEVRVARGGPAVCQTPCTLRLAPGPQTVWTGGRGLRAAEVSLLVPAEGARVRVRAVSRGRLVGGIILTTFGASSLLFMGTLAAAAYFSDPHDSYNQAMGGVLGGLALLIGLPTLISGAALLSGTAPGIESVSPAAPSPHWTLGLAPLRGGALAGATVVF